MKYSSIALLLLSSVTASTSYAGDFSLTSHDIMEGQRMAKTFEFTGFGCSGDNLSPQLSWQNAPKGTKSFAITAYDPDAPTGSGWWHWSTIDIPANVSELPRGVDLKKVGATEIRNDYGAKGFGGVCPPEGDGMHRYQFTVWALPEAKLDLDSNSSPALVGFMLNAMALDKATLTATYVR